MQSTAGTPLVMTLDRAIEHTHNLPEDWLRARVVGWMNAEGVQNFQKTWWWILAITGEGQVRTAQSDPERAPTLLSQDMARRICVYINRECAHGGAWLVGYFGEMLYLLWKDWDGDIQIPIEVPKPLHMLLGWSMNDFAEHCEQAVSRWVEFHKNMDYGRNQQKKVAQGEKLGS